MNIVFLDADSIGTDIDLSGFDRIGNVTRYGYSKESEMPERVKDADVIIVNKMLVNEETVGEAKNLKLVCVTATGTNNLDKEFLTQIYKVDANVTIYSIVNSLVELSDVNRVQISINGETDLSYKESVPLATVFERNLELVEQ